MTTYPRANMQRVLAGSINPVLRVTLQDQDGDPVAVVGSLLCTITRADGTVVVSGRTTAAGAGLGAHTCALTSAEALTLDVLSASWTVSGVVRATSHHRVVGGFLFGISDVQARRGTQAVDVSSIRAERDRVTDLFERYCGALAPQYDIESWIGNDSNRRVLSGRPVRSLRSATTNGTAAVITGFDIHAAAGLVDADVCFYGACSIGYEHGMDSAPEDLHQAAVDTAVDRLMRAANARGPRVRSSTNELGITEQFTYAGRDHPTGLDEVDAILMDYARKRRTSGIG